MPDVFSIIVIINIVETLKKLCYKNNCHPVTHCAFTFSLLELRIIVLSFHSLQFSPTLLSSYSLSMQLPGGHK